MLKVVSLNLLNDLRYWAERAPLITVALQRLSPDVIAFQEVSITHNNATWLAHQLEGYAVFLASKSGQHGGGEGLAVLSRLPVEGHAVLPLVGQSRIALRVIIRQGSSAGWWPIRICSGVHSMTGYVCARHRV